MRILYTNFHPYGCGGHAPYILNLARSLQGEHQITVATPHTSRLYALASALPGVRCVAAAFSTRLRPMLAELRVLRGLLRDNAYDIVHVNGSSDHRQVMLARMGLPRRPRIVWTKHNTKAVGSIGNWVRARLGTDGVIGVCDFVSRQLHASPYRCNPIQTIRLGVDTHHFRPASPEESLRARQELLGDLPSGTLVLGSVGGTDRDKGWPFLVQAVARLPQALRAKVRLLVAGDPPTNALRKVVGELGMDDGVIFPGQVTDPRRVLAASDVGFVLSVHEAGSYAACESLAMGLPTLVSDAGGLPELVRDGVDGWVTRSADIDALQAWLHDWLRAPSRPAMAKAARAQAQAMFSMQGFVDQTHAFYRQICA